MSRANAAPERVGGGLPESSLREQPSFDQDVVGGQQRFRGAKHLRRALMADVTKVHGGIEDGSVDEKGHRRGWSASMASPTYSCL